MKKTPQTFTRILIIAGFSLLVACNGSVAKDSTGTQTSSIEKTEKISSGYNAATDELFYGSEIVYVVASNKLNETEHLLKSGADVSSTNPMNETLLEIAVQDNSVDMLKLLLKYGAKPNYLEEPVSCNTILATGSSGNTQFYEMPLDKAMKKGNAEIIALLKQAGAKSVSACSYAADKERELLESLQPRY